MISCMIIEDQDEAIELLTAHINKVPALLLKITATDPIEALSILERTRIDLIFLDVEMPGLSGLELIESLKITLGNNIPKIILATGNEDYALAGFDHGVSDFLLKPISFKRFKIAVDRTINEIRRNIGPTEKEDFIFVEVGGKKVRINFKDIVYIEGAGNYTVIITINDKLIVYKPMNSIQDLLPEKDFLRVHKSYIISVKQIEAIQGNEIVSFLKNSAAKNIPIGSTYKENLLKRLNIN